MAKNTIVLGINQTTMAALSMVTIAALIGAPGLGQVVLKAIESLNIGVAFNAGLAIVIMAIVLDRDDDGGQPAHREGPPQRARCRPRWAAAGDRTASASCSPVFGIVQGQQYVWANTFPDQWVHPISDAGEHRRPLVRAARAERDAGVQRLVHPAHHRAR